MFRYHLASTASNLPRSVLPPSLPGLRWDVATWEGVSRGRRGLDSDALQKETTPFERGKPTLRQDEDALVGPGSDGLAQLGNLRIANFKVVLVLHVPCSGR